MSIFEPNVAKRIVDHILSTNDEVLAVLITDMEGNILAANSEYLTEALGVPLDAHKYGKSLVPAALGLIHLTRNVIEEAKAIITIHKDCQLMLIPLPPFQIWVGLVLNRSVNSKDYDIANKIERSVADMLWYI